VSSRKNDCDVLVIGGGPAGLATAIAARQRGFSVTVADGDAPSIDKACGEGLMPEALGALRELGVEVSGDEGYRFRGIRFVEGDAQVSADFRYGQGLGIRRPVLHELLLSRAEQSGVRLLWKTPVCGIDSDVVQLAGGEVRARWIVGADGGSSLVRRWAGLDENAGLRKRFASRRHYRMKPWADYVEIYWGEGVQAYVTPIGRGEICVVVTAGRVEEANFASVVEKLPELKARIADAELASRERGAITAMHKLRRVTKGNVALVGDASGGVDAITGEGLRLAFRQAMALAEAIESGDLGKYERTHRSLARRPRWMGNMMLWLGRNSGIRERALKALSAKPELFARLVSIHIGQAKPSGVLALSAELGWRYLAA
jgi:menaquinone-9 beta-reductase